MAYNIMAPFNLAHPVWGMRLTSAANNLQVSATCRDVQSNSNTRKARVLFVSSRVENLKKNLKYANFCAHLSSSYHPRCELCKLRPCLIRFSEAYLSLFKLTSKSMLCYKLSQIKSNQIKFISQ